MNQKLFIFICILICSYPVLSQDGKGLFLEEDYTLPDPLVMENGDTVKSIADWEQVRRIELLELFEQNQHGRTPDGLINSQYEIVERNVPVMGGKARRTQVRIHFPDFPEMSAIRVCIHVPAGAEEPVPSLLHISFSPNIFHYVDDGIDEGMAWNPTQQKQVPDRDATYLKDIYPEHFIEQGYGIATVYYGDIEPDFDHGGIHGVRSMFEPNDPRLPDEWGSIGGWSWGLSRIMDYFESDTIIDASQVALSGISRLGKTVLWAACQDERFAMAIPMLSGEGGAAISRRDNGETIADLTNPDRYDYWYAPHYADYASIPDTLPVDGHMLLALIAPRYLFQIVGETDTWSDPEGEWIAAKAAEPVFDLYGIPGLGQDEYIDAESPILGHMGFYMHSEGHTVTLKDFVKMTDYMDQHFTNRVSPEEVTVTEDESSFTLTNGIMTTKISKISGDLISLVYRGTETLTNISGHPYVYWSHDVQGADTIETRITINPNDNNGQMAEVSIKGISNGILMGHGPGAPPEGDLAVDVEIRYALSMADQTVYTYCIFEHRSDYPAGDMTEARIAAKLQPFFNHIHVDDARSGPYPLLNEGIDKYVYTALQSENRSYGFTSPEKGLGWFMLIPSAEYLSCGPTKAEFLAHGTNPTVLCYWKSSHYGYANVTLAEGEEWTRIVGPLLLYVNEGPSSEAMLKDAAGKLAREEEQWPYAWVQGVPYAHKDQRAEVRGKIILDETLAPKGAGLKGKLYVGLGKTPYTINTPEGDRTITWQFEGKHCQYWSVNEDGNGEFTISNVPAGTYTLTSFADGVLGEFTESNIEVTESGQVDLGELHWTPIRHAEQLWDIGISNRTATEFTDGDSYFRPGQALRYAELFPEDIDYFIGKSDYTDNWYYAHMPHADDPASEIEPFMGVSGDGKPAPRRIHFTLEETGSGQAYLRIAISGSGGSPLIDVSVNGTEISTMNFDFNDGTLIRHQVYGVWREAEIAFDASLLQKGENTLSLTVPGGSLNNGVVYDYIRLELDGAILSQKNNFTNPEMFIYPNPTSDLLHFQLPNNFSGLIKGSIIDLSGKEHITFRENMEGKTMKSLDVSSLNAGFYLLTVNNSSQVAQQKLSILK